MVDFDFWKDLALQFRALDPSAKLRADWYQTITQSPENPPEIFTTWVVREEWESAPSLCLDFEALARRAGSAIANPENPRGSLDIWLDAVKKETARPGMSGSGLGPGPDEFHESAEIPRVCEASADLCRVLESRALEIERRRRSQPKPEIKPLDKNLLSEQPATISGESVADQLKRLRQESRLTIQQLADELHLDSRSVERHLAGEALPRIGNLGAYELAFSNSLGRKVVISKTPVKRR